MTIPYELDRFPGVIGTFMGRDALTLTASYLGLSPKDIVLLPAYSCKEVLRPFLKRAHVDFYDVRPDLTIDPDAIRAKLSAGMIKVLLIINYFGFLQPFRSEIKRICSENGTILIEDCAHSLLTAGSGETGDLVVYSFRKSLPVPDGGGLKLTGGKSVSVRFHSKIVSNALSVLILAKSALRVRSNVFSRAGIASRTGDLFPAAATPAKEERLLPMSSFARAGIARASFAEIARNKRKDFEFWLEVCRRSKIAAPVFDGLPDGVCPLGFPITTTEDRDSLMSGAHSRGIDLMIHWRLPPGLGSECKNSHVLSARTLTLPIYPDLSPRQRETLKTLLDGPGYIPASPVTTLRPVRNDHD